MNRPTREQWAMSLAVETAKRATCVRRQVGCVLLNERGHVLATGYNGVASGMPHCNMKVERLVNSMQISSSDGDVPIFLTPSTNEYPYACPGAQAKSGTNLDGCHAIHAEQNALLQCKDVYEIYACYTTTSPCMTCTKLLMNTSCKVIYYLEEYTHNEASELWVSMGRTIFCCSNR